MPGPPVAMVDPGSSCPIGAMSRPDLPGAARGVGRVALIQPTGPESRSMTYWSQLQDKLDAWGYEVAPYQHAGELPLACDGDGVCHAAPLEALVGNLSGFNWVVVGSIAEAPATSALAALSVHGTKLQRVSSLEFVARNGDLVVELSAPQRLARTMAEHDDPPPLPNERERAMAQCHCNNHELVGCPDFRVPSRGDTFALTPPAPNAPRVIWRDANIELILPRQTVVAMLETASGDDWDERRAEWAADRLAHLRRLEGSGQQPWLSSRLVSHQRDPRMDALIRHAIDDGHGELHHCSGPLIPYLVIDTYVDNFGTERQRYRLPDGAPLFAAIQM